MNLQKEFKLVKLSNRVYDLFEGDTVIASTDKLRKKYFLEKIQCEKYFLHANVYTEKDLLYALEFGHSNGTNGRLLHHVIDDYRETLNGHKSVMVTLKVTENIVIDEFGDYLTTTFSPIIDKDNFINI